ncbi:hypothetical protein LZP69_12320 [Shewanella sp. AS1]|uniref:hypothetical protein n=1 Tax=Shewanella sp. AS1 TaxID=2907626 RepID=UPI001F463045|nr:hypothetical protein [Shewanella sp. AS1]MCE9679949.1 hypothetical protein [Shewanella sp. AS1]
MKSAIGEEKSMPGFESDNGRQERIEYLEQMLDGNETDLKDEEPDCYVLSYN